MSTSTTTPLCFFGSGNRCWCIEPDEDCPHIDNDTAREHKRNRLLVYAGTPIEQLYWEAHERLQLPELAGLTAQHQIRLRDRHYTIDFALVDKRVAFELDGYAYHASRAAWAKDRRRDIALALLGWCTYRFDGSLVRADAAAVVRMSAEIVRQGTR